MNGQSLRDGGLKVKTTIIKDDGRQRMKSMTNENDISQKETKDEL